MSDREPSSKRPTVLAAIAMFSFGASSASGAPATAAREVDASLERRATDSIEAKRDALIAVRHDLHRHPEPSGEEERTAGVVADRLRALGLEVRAGVGGHGVVGILRGGEPGATVAYRADMDAMRSADPDPVEYRSVVPGVRHICGHDVHTTIGLAIAEGLTAVRGQLAGNVMFLFQPAEENATGAEAMLTDGVFESVRPDAVFGLHTAPMPVGQLAIRLGVMMPGRDQVRVRLSGTGDVAAAANRVRQALLDVVTLSQAQSVAPMPPTGWVAGFVGQPRTEGDRTVVSAMLTLPDDATRTGVRETLEEAVASLSERDGVAAELEYEALLIAGIDNDPATTARAIASVERALGGADDASPVLRLETLVPAFSEDFGSFQEQAPGAFFFLGVSNPEKGTVGMPHTPGYVADDEAIFVGAKAMTAVLLDELARNR
ncbi:MAG TPA: amidohydrolase [Thermoanaerobaculia bacterium]|nr:amidohydrolase [Thermoanaerobaculia bacterium]